MEHSKLFWKRREISLVAQSRVLGENIIDDPSELVTGGEVKMQYYSD